MSFLFRNITNSNQPNSDVPKGVNLKYTSFAKPKEGANEGYNSQKLNETSLGNKTRSNITKSGRPGAGWEDDDEDDSNSFNANQNKGKTFSANNGKQTNNLKSQNANSENILYNVESLTEQNIEHEIKIISEVIQPQGARVKPPDNLLIPFGKACESLKTEIVGSILISNLVTDVPWLILMKTLYAIEFLIKNYQKYLKYFQFHKKIINEMTFSYDENQTNQVYNLANGVISILENQGQAKIEKNYQDELLMKNLVTIQESKANDLLDLDVKKETESNKKKLNAFDLFPTKPQTSNTSNSNQIQNNLLQTQTLDIFDGENPQTNESTQNPEPKRKFKFANKTPQTTTAEQNVLDQPKEQHVVKQNKFDPFSMNSSKSKPQEKPQVVAQEDKKKAFGFIKKPEKDNASSLLDLNLREEKGLNNLNINNLYSSEIKVANNNSNMTTLQQGMTALSLTPKTQTSNLMNMPAPNQNKSNTPSPNLNQKSQLDNLYNSLPQQNLNPMMNNFYYSQMNTPQPGMNNMNMGPMNMGPMNHGPMNMGAMNMAAMNMGSMNMGAMNNMGSMNMGLMNPMNMGAMNMGIGMGPMNMGMGMGMGMMNMGMGGGMGMNATVGMNLMNSNGTGEMGKTLEKEKKEPPKKAKYRKTET